MKKIFLIFTVFAAMFLCTTHVKADYKASALNNAGAKCSLVSNSTGYCYYKDANLNSVNSLMWLDTGDEVTVLTSYAKVASPNKTLCPGSYQYVSRYKPKTGITHYGYYCDTYLSSGEVSAELKAEFQAAGFPESYWSKLAIMKQAHPTWTFKAVKINTDFNTVLANEKSLGRSLIQVTSSYNDYGYLSTVDPAYNYYTDTYRAYDGTNWYAANDATIAYYLDPRNFLSDMYVFQYEGLSYVASISDDLYLNSINIIFANDYLLNFSSTFLQAGKTALVNPIYLASLSKQEVGIGAGINTAISGTYNGMYNFYNIQATSGTDAVYKGLNWAAQTDESTLRPWNTPEKSIVGGAKWIGSSYISKGQDTIYFKKWDVKSGGYWHQYQTNIQAPMSEGNTTYKSKVKAGILDIAYTFYVPVYNNMPASTSLPRTGNQNNYLSAITLDGKNIAGFDGANTTYNYYTSNKMITVAATRVSSKSTLASGIGTFDAIANKFIPIKVVAENGAERVYTINIIYQAPAVPVDNNSTVQQVLNASGIKNGTYITGIALGTDISVLKQKINNAYSGATVTLMNQAGNVKNSGIIVTGDKIKIELPKETKTYEIVVYGDVNGDGKVAATDYVRIKNHIMETSILSGCYKEAADVNKDTKVAATDYVKIKNYIMGTGTISQ